MNVLAEVKTHVQCATCPIRHRAVCSACDEDELARLERIKYYRTWDAGQTIGLRGEPLDFVASVVFGTARLSRTLEDGREQTVGLLLPSDFIGRPGRDTLAYDITAVTDVTLCCFRRRPFERIMAETPHVARRLLEMSLDELDVARDWMLLLGRKTAREKVASFLVHVLRRSILPEAAEGSGELRIGLPLSREAIANYIGLTLETVSRQLSRLQKDGVIRLQGNRGIIVPDMGVLMAETGDDSEGAVIC